MYQDRINRIFEICKVLKTECEKYGNSSFSRKVRYDIDAIADQLRDSKADLDKEVADAIAGVMVKLKIEFDKSKFWNRFKARIKNY